MFSVLSQVPSAGHTFNVSGKTSSNAQKLEVFLSNGSANVALMLSTDFNNGGQVVRRSCVNGNWTDGESDENLTSNVTNPLKRGEEFSFYILVGDSRFHVSINGAKFCTYDFKMALQEIRVLSVSGDVEVVTQVDHRLVFPSLYPLVNNDTDDISFSAFIPEKYKPGHIVSISGIVNGNPAGEFVIMFNENDCCRQLIHFNPRFDQQNVVMNTMHGDDTCSWSDNEIRSDSFPFVLNQQFKIAIAFTESDFKVAVNGRSLMSFSLDHIDLEDDESLWDILTGFHIKAASDMKLNISRVEHTITGKDCDGFESYSNLNAY